MFSGLILVLNDIPILDRFCMSSGPDGANGEFIFYWKTFLRSELITNKLSFFLKNKTFSQVQISAIGSHQRLFWGTNCHLFCLAG